jgi:pimeloyl-ACP methyl ester carboxylesterase
MPTLERDDLEIHYWEHGEGFPILLIAPGGMKSRIEAWGGARWSPLQKLDGYRLIAMDQRNAGSSRAPIEASDGWATYTLDQLTLLDHLEVDRFAVVGMCIGGPYIMGLIHAAPERVAAAVMLQPIGLQDNRDAFFAMFDA